jgi:hypothetical protein
MQILSRSALPREQANGTVIDRPIGKYLAPKAKLGDDGSVALYVVLLDIVQEIPSPTDQHQQPSSAVVIFLVHLEVLGEVLDAFGEERNLYLWGAGV